MPESRKIRVLFVCLGNACRSPIAESIARCKAADIIEPSSAGLYHLGQVVDQTRQALITNGYPVDELFSKPLRRELLDEIDLIINMSGVPCDRVFGELANVEDWIVEDPYGQDPAIYQRILENIESRVLSLASRLRAAQTRDGL